jgi:hypothetical protein
MAIDETFAQEILDSNEPIQSQNAIDSVQAEKDKDEERHQLYVELFNLARDRILELCKQIAASTDTQFNKFHFLDSNGTYPPQITTATAEDVTWDVTGKIRKPVLTSLITNDLPGSWKIKVSDSFVDDDIINHLVYYLSGSLAGQSFTITDNSGNYINYSGSAGSPGDQVTITHSSILSADRLYTGSSTALGNATILTNFSDISGVSEFQDRWTSSKVLIYDTKRGVKIRKDLRNNYITEETTFKQYLVDRDAYLEDILAGNI